MAAGPTCMLCGCTETMACVEAHGGGCSWVSHEPPICSACERVWCVVQALCQHQGTTGSFKALQAACRAHREERYGNG